MKIKSVTFEFDDATKIRAAEDKLDDAYEANPTTYMRAGLQLVIQPMYPNDDLSPLLPLVTANS